MKRKTGWYAVLAACMVSLITGCSEQELVGSGMIADDQVVVLQGSAETKNISRSALSDKGAFSWLKGDMIDVFANDNRFYPFTLINGEGTPSGEFSAQLPGNVSVKEYALSPTGLQPEVDGDVLKLTLPSEYVWDGQQTHAIMMASMDENDNLYFKNLGGLMKLSLSDIKNGCRIEISSEKYQLSGKMSITQEGEDYVIKAVEATEENVVTFTSTSTNGKQAFYLPLPLMDKNKIKVRIYDAAENGVQRLEKTANLAIRRKELVIMPTLTIPEKENVMVKDAATTEDLNKVFDKIKDESVTAGTPDEVIVTINSNSNLKDGEEASATVEVSAPISIPTVLTAPETPKDDTPDDGGENPGEGEGNEQPKEIPVVKIVFDEVPVATGDPVKNLIVLTDGQDVETLESTESKSEVKVSIPNAPEGVKPPSFEISLPTTTVTLTPTQETATFDEVYATTADNTLNVAKGVTIKKLYVLSGNVEVSGNIDYIANHSGKTVYVRVSGSGSVGDTDGDVSVIREGDDINVPFENEDVADGQNIPYEIASLEQLRSLANRVEAAKVNREKRPYAECFYVLTADIDLGKDMLWKPIGTESHSFAGIFDGNDHVIKGVMNLGECDNAGFFGRIHHEGTVKNLTIAADIQIINEDVSTSNVVGAFAGNVDRAIFENCHYTGNISIHTDFMGGIVGTATMATIKLCSNTGNLTNLNIDGTVGGMIGEDNQSNLTGCYMNGNITLETTSGKCGGIVGASYTRKSTTITACWVSGTFVADVIGGIFGSGEEYRINYCYWAHSIGEIGRGTWYPNVCESFPDSTPTESQIANMNAQINSLGWKYKNDGTLVPLEGNTLPSNPIKPW